MIAHPNAGRGRRAEAPESDADLLRRAADRLDAMAAATTGDHWEASAKYPEAWVVDAQWEQPAIPKRGVRNPPPRHYTVVEESSEGDIPEADARWIAAMGPQVAAPLAAWLRAEADTADARLAPFYRDWESAPSVIEHYHGPALATARAILGETGETE